MRRQMATVFALGFAGMLAWGSTASAQSLGRADRLFLFYNYYTNQRNAQELGKRQDLTNRNVEGLQKNQNLIARDLSGITAPDPTSRYLKAGKSSPVNEKYQLPPIYGGRAGGRQYFMRISGFNPPR